MRKYLEKLAELKIYQQVFFHPLGYMLAPALLGAFATLGLAPYNSWPALLAALILVFLYLSLVPSKKAAFLVTLSFFTAYHATSLWWLNFVMEDFGKLPTLLSYSVVILFGIYLSLPYALLSLIVFKFRLKNIIAFNLGLLPLGFVLADTIVGWLFTGFPWTFVGYSCVEGPLAAYAPLLGVRGINLILYLIAGSVALTILRQFIYLPVAGVILIAAVLIKGISFTSPIEGSSQVTLVQGNITQAVRWKSSMVMPTIATYWDLSKKPLQEGRIVIWPESAIPLFTKDALTFLNDFNAVAKAYDATLVTGIQHLEYQNKNRTTHNSIIALGEYGEILDPNELIRYDKRHLVPFGEFVPFQDLLRPLGSIFNFPMSNFTPGEDKQEPLQIGDLKLNPAICYESVFPELIASLDESEVNGILMLSNDSWFGPTRGPQQHLSISRMRTLELQKPMLRVTNSGITAFINEKGVVEKSLPVNEKGVLDLEFKAFQGQTLYSRFGNLPLFIICLDLFIWSLRALKKGHSKEQEALLRLLRP